MHDPLWLMSSLCGSKWPLLPSLISPPSRLEDNAASDSRKHSETIMCDREFGVGVQAMRCLTIMNSQLPHPCSKGSDPSRGSEELGTSLLGREAGGSKARPGWGVLSASPCLCHLGAQLQPECIGE